MDWIRLHIKILAFAAVPAVLLAGFFITDYLTGYKISYNLFKAAYDSGDILMTDPRVTGNIIPCGGGASGNAAIGAANSPELEINLNAPAGSYLIKVRAAYGPQDQIDETMTINSVDSAGNVVDSLPIIDQGNTGSGTNCPVTSGFMDVITSRPINFPSSGDVLIQGTGSRIIIAHVRVYQGAGTPTPTITTPPPTPTPLVCSPKGQNVSPGQIATVNATGGLSRTYTWSAPDGNPSSGNGAVFNVSYTTGGSHTVTVTNGSATDQCQITVVGTPTPTPRPGMVCSPATQTILIGDLAKLNVTGGSGLTYVWTATGGNPASGVGQQFSTTYNTQGNKIVIVKSGPDTAQCEVVVLAPTPTPTVPPGGLVCTPATQSAQTGQVVRFNASGGSGLTYIWTATGGNPSSGVGVQFSTTYSSPVGINPQRIVTVKSGPDTATCEVFLNEAPTPTPTPTPTKTPTPTPTPTPATPTPTPTPTGTPTPSPTLVMEKLVRNITDNTADADSVAADPSETVEFYIRVTSGGNTNSSGVVVKDTLPSNISYVPSSTTVGGVAVADAITGSGLNLGTMTPGMTKDIRFRGTVAAESAFAYGTTVLTNTAVVTSTNNPTRTDYAFVSVTREQPVIIGEDHYQLTIAKYGRNTSQGETSEQTSVLAYPNNSLEFIIRVKSLSNVTVNNVMVRDVLPAGFTYVSNSTSINGIAVGTDDLVTSSGLALGSLIPNQEAVIKFYATAGAATVFPVGLSSHINYAYVSADNIPQLKAELPIVISNGGNVQPGTIETGATGTLWMSLFVSGFVTFMYMLYTKTNFFRRKEIEGIIEEQSHDKEKFNFEEPKDPGAAQ